MKKFSEIIPNYSDYVRLQQEEFCSFESDNDHWSTGQRRYIQEMFSNTPLDSHILDIACGDGVGLREFKKLGFKNLTGIEFNPIKAQKASESNYPVFMNDIHQLTSLKDETFDVVYSSHTLEHAYHPQIATRELMRVLKKGGLLYVVLPFPDSDDFNIAAHGAKYEIGTNLNDNGEKTIRFFTTLGLTLVKKKFDTYREPEIWLTFSKN